MTSKSDNPSDLVLIPNNGCKPGQILPDTTHYYTVDKCMKSTPHDNYDFIQVKHFLNANYIYCPDSVLTLEKRSQKCPDRPFVLATEKAFKINELLYTPDKMYIEHKAKTNPFLNFRVNWDLKPSLI